MIIDGVKWACDACIRGHRVSGCTHSDRELKQIAKKGRPVSQCPHCRHLRKSRSAHVKCDCGERHVHGKDAAKKAGGNCCAVNNDKKDNKASHQCTCCHGARCTCALKKDIPPLDTVPEFPSERKSSTSETRRPRIHTTQSESSLTTFANGHHKPTHKSHHGVHGISPYTIAGHADHHRSSFLDDDDIHRPIVSKSRRMKADKSTSDLLALTRINTTGNSILGLEQGSLDLTSRQTNGRPATSRVQHGLSVNTTQAQFTFQDNFSQDFLQSADSDTHHFSAGLQPSAGWPSFPHFDLDWTYPGLTSSSSSDENDELSLNTSDISRSMTGTGPLPSEASDLGDDTYRLSAASSYIGLPQMGMIGGTRLEEYNVDRYLVDFLPTPLETTKHNLERFLSDTTSQQPAYVDAALSLTLGADSGYDTEASVFGNSYLPQQTITSSTEHLDLLASNIHSPSDSSLLLNMPTPVSTEDDGLVWMRKFSNASNYQPSLDQNWRTPSQSQSPR
ncbi:hypothetical protein BDZ91DRAFT_725912 [Kalaharituber pfeilii]|nr:hypothetical protein BDZ91DRAFT_725912 [Kalaharituber pfeilii]